MTRLERAALFEQVNGLLEEIDDLFKEYGFNPKDFDEELLESHEYADNQIATAYGHVFRLKNMVEE